MASLMQAQTISPITTSQTASFRGLSVVDDRTVWVSGSKGTVGHSTDGGKTWTWQQVTGYETCDFRSIEAFSAKSAIIANAGSPGYILRTLDGGKTWNEVYKNTDSLFFIDGISFWNASRGIVFGDPIDGRMLLLTTEDSGRTWKNLPEKACPKLEDGEAAFAASGTTIRTQPGGKVWIATGGKKSRIWYSFFYGLSFTPIDCPIIQGKSSTGIFSLFVQSPKNLVVVGGDYQSDTLKEKHCFYTTDSGKHWKAAQPGTGGYRSCVEKTTKRTFIATGTSGTDISVDGGQSWKALSTDGYHVIRKAKKGNAVFLAGSGGRVGKLQ